MADDIRRRRKRERREAVKEVKRSQKATGADAPKRKPKLSPPRAGRPTRAKQGADVWLTKIRNTFGAKAAKDVFDMVGEPDRSVLKLCNKLITAYTFALMTAQKTLQAKIGTVGEAGARMYMEDLRTNARIVKDMCNSLVKLRAQYVDEDLDSRPDVIELLGAEHFRSQLTTVTDSQIN